MKMHLITCNDFYVFAISEKDKRLDEDTVNKIKNILCEDNELSISDRIDLISGLGIYVIIIYSYDYDTKCLSISIDPLVYLTANKRMIDAVWLLNNTVSLIMDDFEQFNTERLIFDRDELAADILRKVKLMYKNTDTLFVY